jgi:DNA modification methylase
MNIKKSKRPIGQLQTDPHNPRSLNKEKYKKLKSSIEAFPEMLSVRPLVVADGFVVGGNMRLLALKELGYREVEVIDVSDWTKAQRDEFMIKDNLSFGDWDYDLLANEWNIDDLTEWGMDLWDTEPEEMKGLTDEDDIPEAPQEPITKLGDVWILGEHRVMCGDSTSKEAVEILMDGKKATLIHADPPYGMGKEKDGVLNDNIYKDKLDVFQLQWWKAFRPYAEDNASAYIWGNAPDLWRLWYRGGLESFERLTLRNEIVWDKKHGEGMNSDKHRMFPTATERCLFFMIGEQGFNNNADNYWEGFEPIRKYLKSQRDLIGWNNKVVAGFFGFHPRMADHWFSKSQWSFPQEDQYKRLQKECKNKAFAKDYEVLKQDYEVLKQEFYSTRAYFNNTHDNMTEVWEFERVQGEERHGHATPKPVEMMERVMKSSAPENAIVVEPFLGSGSTLIAAEKTKRKCYGMELDPKYCDVIVKRWEDFTGKKAKKA